MPGSFNPTQPPNRPGLYVRFVTQAQSALTTQEGDTVALAVQADWGPIGEVTSITSERGLRNTFGVNETAWQVLDVLRGGAGEVLAYRLADGTAAVGVGEAVATGGAAPDGSGIYLEARFEGEYGNTFSAEVTEYLPDPSKDVLKIVSSGLELEQYLFTDGDIAGVVSQINDGSAYVVASSLAQASAVLEKTSNAVFTGGNNGAVTLTEYDAALDAFAGAGEFEVIALASEATSVKEAFIDWVRDQNEDGHYVHAVMGGPLGSNAAAALADGLVWSARAQNEHIVNAAGVNIVDRSAPDANRASQIYSGAEKAPYVAGLIANAGITRGITYRSMGDETDVDLPLDTAELQSALEGGVLTFAKHGGVAKVEFGVTTFTDYTELKDRTFSQIRAVRVMEQIGRDFEDIVGEDFIGVKNNTAETRNALIKALDAYLEQLAAVGAVLPGFVVELDPTQDSVSGQSIFIQVQLQFGPELLRVFLTLTAPNLIL